MGRRRPTICTYEDVYESDDGIFSCDPDFNTYHILTEGDSWFTIGGTNLRNPWFSNILFTLRFPKDVLLLNLAYPGDTLKNIAAMPRDHRFKYAIQNQNNDPWNAIVLSAGGNDLIDKADTLILTKSKRDNIQINNISDYCDNLAVSYFLDDIEEQFRRLANIRGNQDIPIIVHTYDYPTPRNSPARFYGIGRLGPWLYKTMTAAEIPQNNWIELSDYLFDALANRMLSLSQGQNRITNFHVINTRNTLERAELGTTGESGDWLNEIHPNKNGYKKIARLIEQKLSEVAGIK